MNLVNLIEKIFRAFGILENLTNYHFMHERYLIDLRVTFKKVLDNNIMPNQTPCKSKYFNWLVVIFQWRGNV